MTKTIAITGSNSGIGKSAALQLAKDGHEIIMICRNAERGQAARDEIRSEASSDNVHLYLADLASFDQIQTTAESILEDFPKIDILMNNAGLILLDKKFSEQGIEKTIAINHFGHYLLTDLLLPSLQKSNQPRIINTSSAAHRGATLDFDDLNYEHRSYSSFGAYGRSKLANILFTHKLAELYETDNLCSYSIHPGFVGSNFAKNNGMFAKIGMTILRPFAKSPKSGAQPLIYLAETDGIEDLSGEYFVDTSRIPFTGPKIQPKDTSSISYKKELEDKLWIRSKEEITKWNEDYVFNLK